MDLKIGLAFSGGGFRASSFSLGVLSYLNEIHFQDTKLLSKVYALSSISGGTITAARYALGVKNGESFNEIYKSLHKFFSETDIVSQGLNNLVSKRKKEDKRCKSLITAFADVYNSHLFSGAKFGTLLDESIPSHIKHLSLNATDFENALQFRFQSTEAIYKKRYGEPEKGIIGNYYFRIPEDVAKDIRVADILAASSCFPGGFEPICFPTDFVLPTNGTTGDFVKSFSHPVGLMDGGIVDNQGIEPILLTEERLKRNNTDSNKNPDQNEFDLLIVSDVTSPYLEGYEASKCGKMNFWRRLSLKSIIVTNFIVLLLSILGIIFSIKSDSVGWSILFSGLITFNVILYLALLLVRKLPKRFQVPDAFMKPLSKLLKVKLYEYETMILNRSNSLLLLTNDVFMKHIRRLNYNKIYKDRSWKNRRIMNAIYELKHGEKRLTKKIEKGFLPKELKPSEKVQNVASLAANMGTTLWFTKEELEDKNMLNSIIACGQITMCWNLLEYIYLIKKDQENTNQNHLKIIGLESQLMEHWHKFNENPFWLVEKLN